MAEFEKIMDINSTGVMMGCKYGAVSMKKNNVAEWKSIINTSSVAGMQGGGGVPPGYTASKVRWEYREFGDSVYLLLNLSLSILVGRSRTYEGVSSASSRRLPHFLNFTQPSLLLLMRKCRCSRCQPQNPLQLDSPLVYLILNSSPFTLLTSPPSPPFSRSHQIRHDSRRTLG